MRFKSFARHSFLSVLVLELRVDRLYFIALLFLRTPIQGYLWFMYFIIRAGCCIPVISLLTASRAAGLIPVS